MKYLTILKKILRETTTSYGGTWGPVQNIGDYGGAFGNSDFYAPGDARNVMGDQGPEVKKKKKKKKKTKSKTKKDRFLVHRRAFSEANEEAIDPQLDCVMFVTDDYIDVVNRVLTKESMSYSNQSNLFEITGKDKQYHKLVEKLQSVIREDIFEENVLMLIGEFDDEVSLVENYQDSLKQPQQPTTEYNQEQLRKGTRIELEHTTDPRIAQTIAMHHLDEDPEYYDKLERCTGDYHRQSNERQQAGPSGI